MPTRISSKLCAALVVLTFAGLAVPSDAAQCGVEGANCHHLAYCENITVAGVYENTCVCPPGTIGDEDYIDNDPPFTSGICNVDLWTVRYVKTASAFGEWRVCGASQKDGSRNHGRYTCHETCNGIMRYGRDDPTAESYPGPWWKVISSHDELLVANQCSAAAYGVNQNTDPYPNEYKSCDCKELVELPSPLWTKCAEEWGACTCNGLVRYGSDTAWADKISDGSEPVPCTNGNFGDPHVGTYKACYCFEGVNRTLPANPVTMYSADSGYKMCEAGAGGYYMRKLGDKMEVNCLYDNKTVAELESPDYGDESYTVAANVYRWVLPTTAQPIEIPPTGLTVNSVTFTQNCADSGCWVIKGIMTTGEAFNDFSVFNTFFLPQAEGSNTSISYDFDYSELGSNVDWTFEPADHPCTSASYEAGITPTIFRISYCCIDEPTVGPTGGLVANYRPTEAFVEWGSGFQRCDKIITSPDGTKTKCWKAIGGVKDTWLMADARCRVAGGFLPSIASEEENTALFDLAREMFPDQASTWIGAWGAWDNDDDDVWVWNDGSEWDYTNWLSGQPDDGGANPFKEDCGEMYLTKGTPKKWNDQECGDPQDEYKYFCQFETEDVCVKNVISRPGFSSPNPELGGVTPCWKIQSSAAKYEDAEKGCWEMGGYLAHVDDAERFHLMKRMLDKEDVDRVWLGLDDRQNEGVFTWANSTSSFNKDGPFPFMGWQDRYPKSFIGNNGNNLDCVVVDDDLKLWKDVSCDDNFYRYVCEIPRAEGATCDSDMPNLDPLWNIPFPVNYHSFMKGKFKGMPVSPGVVDFTNLDPFFGQFSFEIQLDEVELRTKAGQLRGTVGVEYTVDTFLGLSNFRPTGLANGVIDTFSTQTAIHLERTSFFSVSTHGVNQYTFLEYVNMRLISVYGEDTDFTGNNQAVTERTNSSGNVNYVQVTFTLGSEYTVNNNPISDPYTSGLIPLDSVRVGRGTFFADVDEAVPSGMEHVCQEYWGAAPADDVGLSVGRVAKSTLTTMIAQECGPKASMCVSPATIPDNFVSFNIPLGSEIMDGQADASLSNNIFVHMVINALKPSAGPEPNNGDDPLQMKTTLSASIPIVDGGINIFCDGVTAKTDLKDVADADIVVGTAMNGTELSRLRIIEDIASTTLDAVTSTQIDTDSIEAALMTLVLKGQSSYFTGAGNANTGGYSLELDDLITIHLMEDGDAGSVDASGVSTNSKETRLIELLAEAPEDNSDTTGLQTSGYKLNGAFFFDVNRADRIAKLMPTDELLAVCPFVATRPSNSMSLESCILRRDVQERGFNTRVGAASPTAMEILAQQGLAVSDDVEDELLALEAQEASGSGACACDDSSCCEAGFMQSVLGGSDYARTLGVAFAKTIHERYALNGRWTRAFWINPGYEWTPTQTGGRAIFSVSQKLYLFALISLSENIGTRRRMLLASDPTQDSGSGAGSARLQFPVSQKSIMADAYTVSLEKVALFDVEMQLTVEQACLPSESLSTSLQGTFDAYLLASASEFHTAQIVSLQHDTGDEMCGRRRIRSLLADFSSATARVKVLVVFVEEKEAVLNPSAFAKMPGVLSITPDAGNAEIKLDDNFNAEEEGGDESSGSLDTTMLIAIVAGAVGGLLLCAIGAVLFMRGRRKGEEANDGPNGVMVFAAVDKKSLMEELKCSEGKDDGFEVKDTVKALRFEEEAASAAPREMPTVAPNIKLEVPSEWPGSPAQEPSAPAADTKLPPLPEPVAHYDCAPEQQREEQAMLAQEPQLELIPLVQPLADLWNLWFPTSPAAAPEPSQV